MMNLSLIMMRVMTMVVAVVVVLMLNDSYPHKLSSAGRSLLLSLHLYVLSHRYPP